MARVEFTFIYQRRKVADDGDYLGFFTIQREVADDDLLRKHARLVIEEAIEKGADTWLDKYYDHQLLSFILLDDNRKSPKELFKDSENNIYDYQLKYDLTNDGGIVFLENLDPWNHDWKYGNVVQMVRDGYIKGSPKRIIIQEIDGAGGGGGFTPLDISLWLTYLSSPLGSALVSMALDAMIIIGLKWVWKLVLLPIKLISNRGVRKIAKKWQIQQIKYPYQIREFLDKKPEWKLSEIKRRFSFDDQFAIGLLTKLGYEAVGDNWRLTQSKKSINARKRWLVNEKRWKKIENKL